MYLPTRPNDLLWWEAIQLADREKLASFDFGRTSADNAGLLFFQRKWGTIETDINHFVRTRSECARPDWSGHRPSRGVSALVKRLPSPALRFGGPLLYRPPWGGPPAGRRHALPLPSRYAPDPHKEAVATYFSLEAPYWETVYETGAGQQHGLAAYERDLRRRLVLGRLDRHAGRRHLSVLDVGCGPGVFLAEVARRGHTVTGIDLSEEMVRRANARLTAYVGGRVACRVADVEHLPLESDSFDVVLCLGVLPYLRRDEAAVAEMKRVLRTGGLGIAVLPNLTKLGSLLDPYYYLVRCWQYIVGRLRGPRQAQHSSCFGRNVGFGIRRYSRRASVRALGAANPPGSAPECVGFGPLTFSRHPLLPLRWSIALSERLRTLAQRYPALLGRVTNEWIISFGKKAARRAHESLH